MNKLEYSTVRLHLREMEYFPEKPSWHQRVAVAGSKKPFNFRKASTRRKMAKNSRRINRSKKW